MLDIIKSYFTSMNDYLILTETSFYIKNYKKILSIKDDEVIISFQDKTYKIEGESFSLIKNVGSDIQINGKVNNIKIYDNKGK